MTAEISERGRGLVDDVRDNARDDEKAARLDVYVTALECVLAAARSDHGTSACSYGRTSNALRAFDVALAALDKTKTAADPQASDKK